MVIYHYSDDGVYAGATEARENPKRPGEYLIPAKATLTPPPATRSGEIAIYANNSWSVIVDPRGTYYNVSTHAQVVVNDIKTDITGLTREAPMSDFDEWDGTKWVLNEANQKAALWEIARAERDRLLDECDLKYSNAEQWELFTAEQKQAWRGYKKALRDITEPKQNGKPSSDPLLVVWPTPPIIQR